MGVQADCVLYQFLHLMHNMYVHCSCVILDFECYEKKMLNN